MGLKPLKQLHLLSSSRKPEERSSVRKRCSKAEKSRCNYHELVVTAAFYAIFTEYISAFISLVLASIG